MFKPDYSLTAKNVGRLNAKLAQVDFLLDTAFSEIEAEGEILQHTLDKMAAFLADIGDGSRRYESEQVMDALTNDGTVA